MLKTFLLENKHKILEQWITLIIETYPPETRKILLSDKDRFTNPVAYTISEGVRTLFDALIDEADSDSITHALDGIMRIRAVQDLSPSRATNIILLLKKVLHDIINTCTHGLVDEKNGGCKELLYLNERLDAMHARACDLYMKCKEEIRAIQLKEINREHERISRLRTFAQKMNQGAR